MTRVRGTQRVCLSRAATPAARNSNASFAFLHHLRLFRSFTHFTSPFGYSQHTATTAPADSLSLASECDAARQA